MFKSFFPNPKWFFSTLAIWFIFNFLLWNFVGGKEWGTLLGFAQGYAEAELPIGINRFWSPVFLWFYTWFLVATSIFALFWKWCSNNPWQAWSVWGSAFILFNIWLTVQVSVAVNAWYVPFWDSIQKILSEGGGRC